MNSRRQILKRLLMAASMPVLVAPGMDAIEQSHGDSLPVFKFNNGVLDLTDLQELTVRVGDRELHISREELEWCFAIEELYKPGQPLLAGINKYRQMTPGSLPRSPIRHHTANDERFYPGKTIDVKKEESR